LDYRKFEYIVPLFFGCLGSLVFSASLMMHFIDVSGEAELFYEAEAVED
jgi:hypothetical protein